ncbi:hypothetical protein ACFL4W_03420, partial [Planctomycetota bacterium]
MKKAIVISGFIIALAVVISIFKWDELFKSSQTRLRDKFIIFEGVSIFLGILFICMKYLGKPILGGSDGGQIGLLKEIWFLFPSGIYVVIIRLVIWDRNNIDRLNHWIYLSFGILMLIVGIKSIF